MSSRQRRTVTLLAALTLSLVGCATEQGTSETLETGSTKPVLEAENSTSDNCSWRCEIENLAETDPQAALSKLMALSESDTEVSSECHNTAHDVGRIASINIGADDAFALGDLSCGSGYWHGVITQWLADGNEIQELAQDCVTQSGTSMARWECGHGMGHAVVLAKNLDDALHECGLFPDEIRDGCWHGALMQDYTDNPKREPYIPCSDRDYDRATADDYLHTCYSMESVRLVKGPGVSLTREQLYGAIDKCREIADDRWVRSCAAGIAGGVTDDSSPEREDIKTVCTSTKGDRELEDWCWSSAGANMVANLGGIERAEEACKRVARGRELESCLSGVDKSRGTIEPVRPE